MEQKQSQPSPEVVDDTLKVSRNQHHQSNYCGEDQRRRWSQSVDVGHGQNIWLQNQHRSVWKSARNFILNRCVRSYKTERLLPCVLPWQQQSTHGRRWRTSRLENRKLTRLRPQTWPSPSCPAPYSCRKTISITKHLIVHINQPFSRYISVI